MKFGFCVIHVYEKLCRRQRLLNLSPINELGYWFQVEQGPDHLRHSKEVSMASRCKWEPTPAFQWKYSPDPIPVLTNAGRKGWEPESTKNCLNARATLDLQ